MIMIGQNGKTMLNHNTNESGTITVENIHARTRVIRVFGGTGNVEVE